MDNYVSTMDRNMADISNSLSEAAKWEQLAEECSELAQAALKKARKLRGENYTPKSMEEIDASVEEEWADVQLVRAICDIPTNWNIFKQKTDRWYKRLKKYKEVNSSHE